MSAGQECQVTADAAPAHWHMDKRVNLGHLLTTVLLAGAVWGWSASIDRRQSVSETKIEQSVKDNERQDLQIKENTSILRDELKALREDVKDVGRKLDSYRASDRKST